MCLPRQQPARHRNWPASVDIHADLEYLSEMLKTMKPADNGSFSRILLGRSDSYAGLTPTPQLRLYQPV